MGARGGVDARLPRDARRAGFTEMHDAEDRRHGDGVRGDDVFAVDYFGRPAYLAQSPQFYKQQMVGVFERVYEVGPVFRAEPHDTVRHLAEYRSLDVELGFIEDHRDVLAVLREVLAGMVGRRIEPRSPSAAGARPAGGARGDPGAPLRRRAGAGRCTGRRARPRPRARAGARGVGAGRARQRLPGRRGLPDGEAAVLHPPAARRRAVVQQLRPALPRARAGHGRPAPAPPLRLRAAIRARGEDPASYDGVPPGVPARDAAARRVRDRAGALGGPAVGAANVREVTLFPRDLHRLAP